MRNILFLTIILLLLNFSVTTAQKKDFHDSTYIKTFPNSLTTRFYFTNKYAIFTFPSSDGTKKLQYAAKTKLGAGVGLTYDNLSLNGALSFGFLNDNSDQGITKAFDFQFHPFPRSWTIDLLGVFYKGLHINPRGYGLADASKYYTRRDVRFNLLGINAYRVANSKKFSYNAAMVQNEWQKKSAGTLLYGGEIYYGLIGGDSNLVPLKVANSFSQNGLNKFSFITVGPGVGYAYTLVVAKHFFAMASLTGNMNVNFSTEHKSNSNDNKTSFDPCVVYKSAIGYNGNIWSVTADIAGNCLWVKGNSFSKNNSMATGNYRFVVAKKIQLKKPIRFIDNIANP